MKKTVVKKVNFCGRIQPKTLATSRTLAKRLNMSFSDYYEWAIADLNVYAGKNWVSKKRM